MKLLAKSQSFGIEKRLGAHIEDDLRAFEALFGARTQPTRLASEWLRFFRLSIDQHEDFWVNGITATGLHDLGKANDGFQDAVRQGGAQVVRHEHLSAFLVMTSSLTNWLAGLSPSIDLKLVVSAVLGHHLKSSQETLGKQLSDRERIAFANDHEEVHAMLAALAKRFSVAAPEVVFPRTWSFDGHGESIYAHADRLGRRFRCLLRALRDDDAHSRMYRAVKAAVIVADSAGSGLAREGHDVAGWLTRVFDDRERMDGGYIEDNVLAKRRAEIENRHGRLFCYHSFQEVAASMPTRTLMIAPCGSGKTLAAWRWIKACLDATPRARVVFLYPTRATATEGFRDYVAHAPESHASLLTGTAAYELRDMFANPADDRRSGNYLTESRLYALGYWNKRMFSATVDQFLSFMQQSYKGICLLPVLADAVVVVDEVHSFDVGLFDAFRKFLHHFDVPVLAMTASLPAGRRRALVEEEGLQLFTGAGLADLERIADKERYEVAELESFAARESEVRATLAARGNVLWVVNTVDRAQHLARCLAHLNPICYHSRFTLDDRKTRHAEVIAAFQVEHAVGLVAITTQVCEMSLDLDAQMLVSEFAPISALIQRMGRCNRLGRSTPGRVCLYRPDADVPYSPDEMRLAERFVAEIVGRNVTQSRLEELLEHFTEGQGREADRWTAFIDDGPWAMERSDELRDSTDYTVQAVLDDRIDAFLSEQRLGRPTDGFILPVPRGLVSEDHRLPRYLRRAPSDHYEPALGFLRHPVSFYSDFQGGRQ